MTSTEQERMFRQPDGSYGPIQHLSHVFKANHDDEAICLHCHVRKADKWSELCPAHAILPGDDERLPKWCIECGAARRRYARSSSYETAIYDCFMWLEFLSNAVTFTVRNSCRGENMAVQGQKLEDGFEQRGSEAWTAQKQESLEALFKNRPKGLELEGGNVLISARALGEIISAIQSLQFALAAIIR